MLRRTCFRTNRCYNERGSRTNYFRYSLPHCVCPACNSAVASTLLHSDIMGPASYFGTTYPDVNSSARTAASHSDTVATVSNSVTLPQHLILLLLSLRHVSLFLSQHPVSFLLPTASDIRFLLCFPYHDIYFHIIAPHSG
jgi:hypothetical protein